MARLPRNTDPTYVRHISIRTEQAALYLVPDPSLNQTVGGILAKYQEELDIVIYAYTVLSNHIHILARAPKGNLWRFEQSVNREVAKRINRARKRRGHFWERRYDEQMVAREADIVEAFIYVTLNAVKHGLVEHPKLWPGLSCYEQALSCKPRKFRFINYTRYNTAKRQTEGTTKRININDYETQHTLTLTPLPGYEHLGHAERRRQLQIMLDKEITHVKRERRRQGLGFLGRVAVLKQKYTAIPKTVKRSPRPICYTKSWEAKKEFMSWFFPWLEQYRRASQIFRSGDYYVTFPEHCIRPPLHYNAS